MIFELPEEIVNGERWIETARFGDEFQGSDSIARFIHSKSLSLYCVTMKLGKKIYVGGIITR